MPRALALLVVFVLVPGLAAAAPDCDGAWIRKIRMSTKRSRLDVLLNVVRPGVTHETLVGPEGLHLRLVHLGTGTPVRELDVPQAAFTTRGKRTQASGGDLPGSITITQAAGQADAVSVRVKLTDTEVPAAAFD